MRLAFVLTFAKGPINEIQDGATDRRPKRKILVLSPRPDVGIEFGVTGSPVEPARARIVEVEGFAAHDPLPCIPAPGMIRMTLLCFPRYGAAPEAV